MAVINAGILTISDRCSKGLAEDVAGATLLGLLGGEGMTVLKTQTVSDDVDAIQATLKQWCDEDGLDVVITTGGTGFTNRDVTPEACIALFDKEAPGVAVALTLEGLNKTPMAMLSRLRAGIRKKTFIVNFPGSVKACKESFARLSPVIKHAVDQLREDRMGITMTHLKVQEGPTTYKIADAVDIIIRETEDLQLTEVVSIKHPERLIGRVVVSEIQATVPLPPFPASIKDGYAVITADGAGPRQVSPLSSTAGIDPADVGIISGFCVRINTGAPVPRGADAVVQVEDTELLEYSDVGEERIVNILKQPQPGQEIRQIGTDIHNGEKVIEKGTELGPIEVGLIAAVGHVNVKVFKRPTIALLSTGDEIVPAGTPLERPGQIWDSNKTTLLALFEQQNFPATDMGIALDNADDICTKVGRAFDEVDILVTTGGVSMGEKDLLKRILIEDFKATIHFGRVNLKPGKPTAFCTCNWNGSKKIIFALPGNPTSATVTSLLFVLPALRHIAGTQSTNISADVYRNFYKTIAVTLELDTPLKLDERPEFVRATITFDSDGPKAKLVRGSQRSSRLLSMKNANALVVLPQASSDLEEITKETVVNAILF
ncbi:Molybdenum cofactor synthesis protein cinnamon [Halotydeus destructor]|nr:Molybdenum cofactor synthesis protein cinnamon [Halotydeus destructor]